MKDYFSVWFFLKRVNESFVIIRWFSLSLLFLFLSFERSTNNTQHDHPVISVSCHSQTDRRQQVERSLPCRPSVRFYSHAAAGNFRLCLEPSISHMFEDRKCKRKWGCSLHTSGVCRCVSVADSLGLGALELQLVSRVHLLVARRRLPSDELVCLWRRKQQQQQPPASVSVCVNVCDHMVETWQEQRSPNSSSSWSSSSSSPSQNSSSFLEVGPRNSSGFIQRVSVCPFCDVIMQDMSTEAWTTLHCCLETLFHHNMYSITFNSIQA